MRVALLCSCKIGQETDGLWRPEKVHVSFDQHRVSRHSYLELFSLILAEAVAAFNHQKVYNSISVTK